MDPSSIPKTAVINPFGTFVFLKMSFGLMNAGSTFQRLMDQILEGLDCVFIYLDDILIASDTLQEHKSDVWEVLDHLRQAGLYFNPAKSNFFQTKVKYLGHQVSTDGIVPLKSNKEKIINFKTPDSKDSLKKFQGVINFYCLFLWQLATILKSLTNLSLLKFQWSQACDYVFQQAKDATSRIPTLQFPLDDVPTRLCTDASDLGCGAVLEQFIYHAWVPLEFFSAKFSQTERNYSMLI